MQDVPSIPRLAHTRVLAALADTPVVLIQGPRQSGKSWLAQQIAREHGYRALTFDDDVTRNAANTDPMGFVRRLPERACLDEVQHCPAIFSAIKTVVDDERVPGRFLLTGSSNVLLMPRLSDSLAGRMEVVRLHPLAAAEIERQPCRILDALFEGEFGTGAAVYLGPDLATRIARGGYPVPVLRSDRRRQRDWYRNYLESILQRDVPEIARIAHLEVLPKLMSALGARTSRLFNAAELSAPFEISRPTIATYVSLLRRIFLVDLLPPWHTNQVNRLVKTPKLHVVDTGLVTAMLGHDAESLDEDRELLGSLVETFVFQELQRLASGSSHVHKFHHYRDRDGHEVDIVVERDGRKLVGVEVKAGSTVRASDFRGIRRLRDSAGSRFTRGVIFYDGEEVLSFGKDLLAVPLSKLWTTS